MNKLMKNAASSAEVENIPPENEKFTFVIPYEISEWVRNYHYTKILETGNIGLTLKDVMIEAFTTLKETTKLKVRTRPEEVRKTEKRAGRKRKININ